METVGATWVLLVLSIGAADVPAEPAAPAAKMEAADLAQAALRAEAAGKSQARRELLWKAIKQDPACELAHWSSGEVLHDGRWLPVEEAQRLAAADQQLAEYRKLRDRLAGTPEGEQTLATWCREHGLWAESRVHWRQVLMAQPNHDAAQKAMGTRWYQGQLLTGAQLEQMKQANKEQTPQFPTTVKAQREAMDGWIGPVAKWRRALKQGDASVGEALRAEVASANAPQRIHALGLVLMNGSRPRSADPKGYQLVSLALIDALNACGKPWAVQQLAWLAVEHSTPDVRNAAADALKNHPRLAYVPWLISHMQSPVSGGVVLSPQGVAGVTVMQTFEREGFDAVYRNTGVAYHCVGQPRFSCVIDERTQTRKYDTNIPQVAYRSWRDAQNYAAATENQLEQFNATVEDLNKRIAHALSRATGEKVAADPIACQRWWMRYFYQYYELEQPASEATAAGFKADQYPYDYGQPPEGKKPVVERWRTYGTPTSIVATVTTIPVPPTSCFPSDTPVWTQTGVVKIREIKPGDRVLSQEPFSGKLSYQAVLRVTRRKPSPMLEIGLGSETIRTTRGHPFWVCGEGWKMAKELAVGMWLHSTDGPVRIESLSELPAARPWNEQPDALPGEDLSYNLVLEACHNYFVGQQRILVHDNTLYPFDGPVPTVPGLTAP
ncbi:MAG: polymorphic toxin-type HINT domain-containing protein [Thermoguttaceae bacterium]